jgi:NADPH:quinone reductase
VRPAAPDGIAAVLDAAGDLTVPLARTFPFEDARGAVTMLAGPHPSGKLALVLDA